MSLNSTKTVTENIHEMCNEEYSSGDFPADHKSLMVKLDTVSEIQILLNVKIAVFWDVTPCGSCEK
jgi:hypothetical protein